MLHSPASQSAGSLCRQAAQHQVLRLRYRHDKRFCPTFLCHLPALLVWFTES
jgi:hypothetical protein